MKKFITSLSLLAVLLSACVDTTGIVATSTKKPLGSTTAPVVLTEYGDFQCPACRVSYDLIVKPLLKKYGTKVQLEFKQFPLLTIHEYSMPLAEASECAADQGKFWEFVDMAYEQQLAMDKNQTQFEASDITTWATKLGLDMSLFGRCTTSHIKRKAVMADFDGGQKLGVNGTPTFFVNGKKLDQNDLASLTDAIDAALKTGGQRKL